MEWNQTNDLFVKEHVGMFKAANNFDVYDGLSQEQLLMCREPNLGFFTKMLRFTDYKRSTPFHIDITDMQGNTVVEVRRGISVFLSKVVVSDGSGRTLGFFKQKLFSIGGAFRVLDENERPVCELKGKWTSWNFRFMHGSNELAEVSKNFAGFAKELFTSADNYRISISDSVEADSDLRKLILAAVMCIDMVLKE